MGDTTDSFTYLETPDDAQWSQNAFQYAVQVWLPSVFRDVEILDATLASSASTQATIERIVQGCLANRMHMFSLLAASTAFQKYVLRLQNYRHDTPEYCMGKALQYLRHHLASNPEVDELLIFDLETLAAFERYVGNFQGARTHLVMVQHLVRSLGDLGRLQPSMRPLCWLWDLAVAGGLGEPPLLPLLWDHGSLPGEQMVGAILPDLSRAGIAPSGSALLRYTNIVHPVLSDIIVDTVQWFHVQQHHHVHNYARSPTQSWASRQVYTLVHRLLSWSADPADASHQEILYHAIAESIKQALLVVISDIERAPNGNARTDAVSMSDPTMFSWSNIGRLRAQLLPIYNNQTWTEQDEEIVLWMVCLGVQHATDAQDRDWFGSFAARLTRRRDITRDDMIQLMARYLHRCESTGRPDIDGLQTALAQ
ncbi:hypothetical protein A1O3_07389 [Capronia epimyces CBS 606.96]|uniref:Transcription factor domain-containing protein n=1 Tax=Capronia epimyces CBS 606.96 TaxID=1182542 RepID=W9XVR7_9EURO|nr:uncharacterized protein A1O3_07389 [Capronia epimyces CBS 606.96]EXJ81101.1 hypothetical protein A1O3_07389 [Capronia epimyces CBS 606.96]